MAKRKSSKYHWVYSPKAAPKPKVPDEVKLEVTQLAQDIIEEWKPKYLETPPQAGKYQFMGYVSDLYTKWHRSYFYFFYKMEYPGPNAKGKCLEESFTRLEYTAAGTFNLAYRRHTGQWWEVSQGQPLTTVLDLIRSDSLYHPPHCGLSESDITEMLLDAMEKMSAENEASR